MKRFRLVGIGLAVAVVAVALCLVCGRGPTALAESDSSRLQATPTTASTPPTPSSQAVPPPVVRAPRTPPAPEPAPPAPDPLTEPRCPPPCAQPGAGSTVEGLTAVLARTKSKDIFAATVLALGHLGIEARPALPAIFDNAERLGALEGSFHTGGSKSDQGDVVLDAIEAISGGKPLPWPPATPACCVSPTRCCGDQPAVLAPPPGGRSRRGGWQVPAADGAAATWQAPVSSTAAVSSYSR